MNNNEEKTLARTELTQKDIETLVAVGAIPPGTPPNVVGFFSRACGETRLSPFKRQLHLIKRGDKYTIQTAIDGFRTIADRTGRYAGNDDYVFNGSMSEWQMLEAGKQRPETATATVWKIVGGVRCPFSATTRWSEYLPGDALGFMWKKMPFLMLGKCSEALALRKAFPEETSGIYTEDEVIMDGRPEISRPIIKELSGAVKAEQHSPAESGLNPALETGALAAQKSTKLKRKRKPAKPPPQPFPPNEMKMHKRLAEEKFTDFDLIKVAQDNGWIESDIDTLAKIGEQQLGVMLADDNWQVVLDELKVVPKTEAQPF